MSDTVKGAGCLVLFSLPFAGAGTFVAYLSLSMIGMWADTANWVETPARIHEVELIEHHGDDSTTWEVEALYEYPYLGATYRSRRVALSGGADNIGSFQRDAYERLRQAHPGQPWLWRPEWRDGRDRL